MQRKDQSVGKRVVAAAEDAKPDFRLFVLELRDAKLFSDEFSFNYSRNHEVTDEEEQRRRPVNIWMLQQHGQSSQAAVAEELGAEGCEGVDQFFV